MPSVIYLPTEIGCGSGGGIVRIHSEMKFRNSPNINSIANVESGIVRNASVILLGYSVCEIFYRDRFNMTLEIPTYNFGMSFRVCVLCEVNS